MCFGNGRQARNRWAHEAGLVQSAARRRKLVGVRDMGEQLGICVRALGGGRRARGERTPCACGNRSPVAQIVRRTREESKRKKGCELVTEG